MRRVLIFSFPTSPITRICEGSKKIALTLLVAIRLCLLSGNRPLDLQTGIAQAFPVFSVVETKRDITTSRQSSGQDHIFHLFDFMVGNSLRIALAAPAMECLCIQPAKSAVAARPFSVRWEMDLNGIVPHKLSDKPHGITYYSCILFMSIACSFLPSPVLYTGSSVCCFNFYRKLQQTQPLFPDRNLQRG